MILGYKSNSHYYAFNRLRLYRQGHLRVGRFPPDTGVNIGMLEEARITLKG